MGKVVVSSNWKKLKKTLLPAAEKVARNAIVSEADVNSQGTIITEQATTGISKIQKKKVSISNDKIGKYIAIDCEMVGVGSMGSISVLARVSLVNFHGHVILDEYVLPQEHIIDYRTNVSGITPNLLRQHGKPFQQVQKRVSDILKDKIVVGHALKNDFKALLLDHPKHLMRDTSLFKKFRNHITKRPRSLKSLALEYLGKAIQDGEHSSVEDARCALELFKIFKVEWDQMLFNYK